MEMNEVDIRFGFLDFWYSCESVQKGCGAKKKKKEVKENMKKNQIDL